MLTRSILGRSGAEYGEDLRVGIVRSDETKAQERLISTLDRLSAAPAEQELYLRSLRLSSADELALDLDDELGAVMPTLAKLKRGGHAAEKLSQLDQALDSMSGVSKSDLWTFDALHTSRQWDTVRKLASEAKAALLQSDKIAPDT